MSDIAVKIVSNSINVTMNRVPVSVSGGGVDYRKNMSAECDGTEGQYINYSSEFLNVRPVLFDYNGIGIEVTSFDENGFTITSESKGFFGYETRVDK